MRVAEIVVRELEKAKPDKWGCVKVRELWSPEEERQVRPGHFWLLKFGKVPGSTSCVEKSEMEDGNTEGFPQERSGFTTFNQRWLILFRKFFES